MSRLNGPPPNLGCSFLVDANLSATSSCAGSSFTGLPGSVSQCYDCSSPYTPLPDATRTDTNAFGAGSASVSGVFNFRLTCCPTTAGGGAQASDNAVNPKTLTFSSTPCVNTVTATVSENSCCNYEGPPDPTPADLSHFAFTQTFTSNSFNFIVGITTNPAGGYTVSLAAGTPYGVIMGSTNVPDIASIFASYSFSNNNGETADGKNNGALSASMSISPA